LPLASLLFSSGVAAASYQIAPIFLIRMTGVPFETLENLATVETTRMAREFIAAQTEFSRTKGDAESLLASCKHDLSKEQFRAWRKAVRTGVMPPAADPPSTAFVACWNSAAEVAKAEAALNNLLPSELGAARESLFAAARKFLPLYLVFAAEGVRERVLKQLVSDASWLPPRNKQARADERHLVLYLQRISGKNDSLSEFGPQGWGMVVSGIASLKFGPRAGIARRETFLERWTAHGTAAAINADPEAGVELAPRLHPNGRLEQNHFVDTETGETVPLDPETRALLVHCDGATPAHSLGVSMERLEKLARQNLIRWEMEVPALEPHAFDVLISDISRWRDGPVRRRWLDELQPLAILPEKFARTVEPLARLAIIDEATERLEKLGAHQTATRFLYAATNPIGEECFRECNFSISENLINQVALEAAPWIDLWRDNYAFVASRVAAGLRGLLEQAPLQNGALPLPAFLRHCATLKMPLTGPGMIAFAHSAFQEVKTAFHENLQGHVDQPEYELTAEDCQFVRRDFDYESFDEYTYPSADLQLGAQSVEAVARGEYQWVLAELHPPVALLHHGFHWACPDKEALTAALTSAACGQPNFHFGYFAADFTATTTVRLFAGVPDFTYFVAPQRGNPDWQVVPPAESEVFINEDNGDVGLRKRASHEYLGSFARAWTIPLGFHPFSFSLGAQTPRLLCGKVVVQRRSWTVALEELGAGDFTGISPDLVTATERLRTARQLPRHVYIRPTEQALRRSGVEGRDKDTKPVFIDFESYLFLEIFHRWLVKAGELEVTEMLPAPDQLLWQEPDGRRTFELRTQIIPR
jgi:hypothetical protein